MAAKNKKPTSKLEDIAKPGNSPVSDNARPTITGHQSMVKQDPMMAKQAEENTDDAELSNTHSTKIKINPISDDFSKEPKTESEDPQLKEDSVSQDKELASVVDSNEKEKSEQKTEEEQKKVTDAGEEASSQSAEIEAIAGAADSKKVDTKKAEEDTKKQEQIKELIKSRKYSVPIVEGGHKATSQKLMSWLLLFMLLISVGAYFAADAGYINIGIDLPYEFIKN